MYLYSVCFCQGQSMWSGSNGYIIIRFSCKCILVSQIGMALNLLELREHTCIEHAMEQILLKKSRSKDDVSIIAKHCFASAQ